MFETVVVVGLGLIGGSFSLDLKKKKLTKQIIGYDQKSSHCDSAVALGIVDRAFTQFNEEIAQADLVVLAVPVKANASVMKDLYPWLKSHIIVSDVGSVKTPILNMMETAYPDVNFVAGHPISGGENFGPKSARNGLFENKSMVFTPSDKTSLPALEQLKTLWSRLGSNVREMTADTHDYIYAAVSHMPHLLAYATIDALAKDGSPDIISNFGAGLKDFSRIAASSPEMWADIFLENQTHLTKIVQNFRATLDELESLISQNDKPGLVKHLENSKNLRDDWITKNVN